MIAHLSCLKVSFVETLDQYDRAILQELQQNGRLTNAELAQRVSLSAAPCWRRVRALEAAGFISGYTAVINRRKVGLGVLAFVRLDADRNDDTATRTAAAYTFHNAIAHIGVRCVCTRCGKRLYAYRAKGSIRTVKRHGQCTHSGGHHVRV